MKKTSPTDYKHTPFHNMCRQLPGFSISISFNRDQQDPFSGVEPNYPEFAAWILKPVSRPCPEPFLGIRAQPGLLECQ